MGCKSLVRRKTLVSVAPSAIILMSVSVSLINKQFQSVDVSLSHPVEHGSAGRPGQKTIDIPSMSQMTKGSV
jgi:hypothetical protein